MLDYISYGPPLAVPPGQTAGQTNTALAADIQNGALYVSVPGGVWRPAGSGLVGSANLAGQTSASISATTIYTVTTATAGMYSLDWYTKLTTTGTSPVLGPLTITFNDAIDGTAQSVVAAGQTQAGAAGTSLTATTTAQNLSGALSINAGAGNIQYAFVCTGTIGAAVYELRLRLEFLGQ
jgi:hypothetical protein